MMDFPVYSFDILGIRLYAYGLVLALAALLALLMLYRGERVNGLRPGSAAAMLLLGGLLGLFGARLLFSLVSYKRLFFDAMEGSWLGLRPFFALSAGGFSLFGLLFGWLLAGWLFARLSHQEAARVMDWLAIPSALFIAIARFGEILGGQGYGEEMAPWLQFFPLALRNSFDEWYLAVCVLEGLAALLIALWLRGRRANDRRNRTVPAQAGNLMLRMLIPFSALQIFFESLRQDAYLRLESNAFIRLGQLLALAVLLAALILLSLRAHKKRRLRLCWPAWLSLLAAAACVIAAEFNEKLPVGRELLYILSFLSLGAHILIMLKLVCQTEKEKSLEA